MTALERKIKAKIPGEDTGIEIKHSLCDICSPNEHCGINAYIKDGRIIKIEGTDGHPKNNGMLCTRGAANRSYIYREDRLRTPLRRVGKRGEGKFEPISWDEAIAEIAERLNAAKQEFGPESVAFFSGFSKWYRPMYQRFAHSFGSPNYGTESSCCYTSVLLAWKLMTGYQSGPDMGNSDLFLGWACNPYHANYLFTKRVTDLKEKGLKFIIIDPRKTPAVQKLADLVLSPRPGTDGALALCMANILIENDWINKDFIEKYTYGFEDYKEYVKGFNESNIEELTGVPYSEVYKAAVMISQSKRVSSKESAAALTHHRNGMQNYRAIKSLHALRGDIDRPGGQMPGEQTYLHEGCGYTTREHEVEFETYPQNTRPAVGAERFPLWYELTREMQSMDMVRQILEEKPYPIKALFALGMNARMFPNSGKVFEALEKVDFFVDCDIFDTDTAKYADIVLPCCSSFERGEFKPYAGGYATFTKPVIEPLYESRSDTDILCMLANALELPDPMLRASYREVIREIIRDLPITIEELEASDMPIQIVKPAPRGEYEFLDKGLFKTPTKKFEFKSALIEAHPEWGLNALPTYVEPLDGADAKEYPFTLMTGPRLPGNLHSRFHKVPYTRILRPDAMADISIEDAERLGIHAGDWVEISTLRASISVRANPTITMPQGLVNIYHGYSEADANLLLDENHLDPYSGFAAFRSTRCALRRKNEE